MKNFLAIVLNGFLGILFPLAMTIILLEKLHHLLYPLTQWIEEKLQLSRFVGVLSVILISIVVLLLLGFLCGVLIKSAWIRKRMRQFEENVLEKIPLYSLAKSVFGTTAGIANEDSFRPAVLCNDDAYSLCYVTNESKSFFTVFVCEGGLSGGEVQIVPKERVKLLNLTLVEFTRMVKKYGMGSARYVEEAIRQP